jgi:predicted RNA-binding protein YlxR (DUF448 family)
LKAKSKATRKSRVAPRRQPQRTCIICRQTSNKRSLVRIVRTAQGAVQIDERGKVPGRGAYLCEKVTCWDTALQTNALSHALNTPISDETRAQLAAYSKRFINRSTPMETSQ